MIINKIALLLFLFIVTKQQQEKKLDIRFTSFSQNNKNIFDQNYRDNYSNFQKFYVEEIGNNIKQENAIITNSNKTKITNKSQNQTYLGLLQKLIYKIIKKASLARRQSRKNILRQNIPIDIQNQKQNILIDISTKTKNRCKYSQFMIEYQVKYFTRVAFSTTVFTPGAIIQLTDFSNFAKGILPLQINHQQRNHISVKIQSGSKVQKFQVISFNYQNFIESLSKMASNDFIDSLKIKKINLYIEDSTKTSTIIKKLSLSTKIYEHLQIGSKQKNQCFNAKKKIIILHQSLFTATLDINNTSSDSTLFSIFFNKATDELVKHFTKSSENDQKLPQFIYQANFGRLLVLSVNDNEHSNSLINKLQNCFRYDQLNKQSGFNTFNNTMREIIRLPQLRYYLAGVDQNTLIQRMEAESQKQIIINWQNIFFQINRTSINKLQPLAANIINFIQQKHSQIQRIYFYQQQCINKIELLFSMPEGIIIIGEVKKILNSDGNLKIPKYPFNMTHPGTFQIGSLVGNNPFQLKLIVARNSKKRQLTAGASYGLKYYFLKKKPIYSIQSQFALLINGEQKFRAQMGNLRCDCSSKALNVVIDPNNINRTIIEEK